HSGYAVEARSYTSMLRNAGFRVREVPVASRTHGTSGPGFVGRKQSLTAADLTIVHLPWHDSGWENTDGTVVWRAMFETASVPPAWLPRLSAVDEVWVPSNFNAATFASAGVAREKLKVIPETIDRAWGEILAAPYKAEGTFRFLSVFRWQYRKGWDVLLNAYLSEFNSCDDDVELVIRADPLGAGAPGVGQIIESFSDQVRPGRTPRITLLNNALSEAELRSLYRSSHAFVLPTRGEAWGRPFMEAMACGLITIGTGWGGQCDFMNTSNSLLIDYSLAPVPPAAVHEWPYFHGQIWAEPSVESLRDCMRRAVEGGPTIVGKRQNAADSIRELYSPEKISEALIQAVNIIIDKQQARDT
ncbi:glycosyltransferase family 4 protein, partial [Arthrobacter agilis]|uniref:glycosyltransferase family 4 protein n=1 Tax=Arthrobacter agilis TaxID=37921 RepID=UPI001ABF5CAD